MTTATGALEHRLRRELYRFLAGDAPDLPRCPCGAQTFIGDRYSRSQCAELTTAGRRAVDDVDERFAGPTRYEPCPRWSSPGSRFCAFHRKRYPDEPPLPGHADEHGHSLRCGASLVPPWLCPHSTLVRSTQPALR